VVASDPVNPACKKSTVKRLGKNGVFAVGVRTALPVFIFKDHSLRKACVEMSGEKRGERKRVFPSKTVKLNRETQPSRELQ